MKNFKNLPVIFLFFFLSTIFCSCTKKPTKIIIDTFTETYKGYDIKLTETKSVSYERNMESYQELMSKNYNLQFWFNSNFTVEPYDEKIVTLRDTIERYYKEFIIEYDINTKNINDNIDIKKLNLKQKTKIDSLKKYIDSHTIEELHKIGWSNSEINLILFVDVKTPYQLDSIHNWLVQNEQKYNCYNSYIQTLEAHPERYNNVIITTKSYYQYFEIIYNDKLSYFGKVRIDIVNDTLTKQSLTNIRFSKGGFYKWKDKISNCN